MVARRFVPVSLALSLVFVAGCPGPGDDGGAELGSSDTGETGDTGSVPTPSDDDDDDDDGDDDSDGGGIEDGGDVHPPVLDGDDGGDDVGDGDGDEPGPIDHPGRCWDRTWNGNQLPAVIHDNTIGRNDDMTGSCGIGPAPDFQLGFMAPHAGTFTFDTTGSSFDTVLIVMPDSCGEVEVACNDDFIGLDSRLSLQLEAHQMVTVTVDGTGPFEEGPLTLTISEDVPIVCEPELIVPSLPQLIVGDTSLEDDLLTGDCGGAGAPEHVFEFVAPGPGQYRFSTLGSSFDTVLYTLDGCDGPPLLCNDDIGLQPHSELILDLAGGQRQLIVVDGYDANEQGAFELFVEQL